MFDKEKYKTLMSGLECSEVSYLYVVESNAVFRLDSFFYAKKFLNDENQIKKYMSKTFKELKVSLKSFGAYSLNNYVNYLDHGIPFIRGINMKNGMIQTDDMIYISQDTHKILWKSEVFPKNVLLSMSGTIGSVAIALPEWHYPVNSNQDIAKIDFHKNLNPYYAYAFLLSKYGQNYLQREARGSVQQHVFLSQIEEFRIPVFSDTFQKRIEDVVCLSHLKYRESLDKYKNAETIFLIETNMYNFKPTKTNISIKSFANSFCSTGRLDAEYYQSKYDDYVKILNAVNNLSEICNIYDKNFIPNVTDNYKYIELSNIGLYGDINDVVTITGKDLPSRARRLVHSGQLIVSSVEGSLASCAIITDEFDNSLCSTGFYVIDSDDINVETLLVIFKSEPIQALLKQHCSGTILTAINKDEFLKIPLPKIDGGIQRQIMEKIQQSFRYSWQSKKLLEIAKRIVEIAIEKDEDTAIQYINNIEENEENLFK